MDRYAIFVDAGYFFAAGAQAAFGLRRPPITRKQVSVKSSRAMLDALCHEAAATTDNLPLLRVYWYDAMPGPRMSLDQSALALLSGVKLRLGALNSTGEQKGVDSLIVTDIIDLARNRAISDAVVVTGDEDLRIAFQVAQSFGVRVHILAAGDPTSNVSPSLQMEADSVTALEPAWFSSHFDLIVPTATSSPPPSRTSDPPQQRVSGSSGNQPGDCCNGGNCRDAGHHQAGSTCAVGDARHDSKNGPTRVRPTAHRQGVGYSVWTALDWR